MYVHICICNWSQDTRIILCTYVLHGYNSIMLANGVSIEQVSKNGFLIIFQLVLLQPTPIRIFCLYSNDTSPIAPNPMEEWLYVNLSISTTNFLLISGSRSLVAYNIICIDTSPFLDPLIMTLLTLHQESHAVRVHNRVYYKCAPLKFNNTYVSVFTTL